MLTRAIRRKQTAIMQLNKNSQHRYRQHWNTSLIRGDSSVLYPNVACSELAPGWHRGAVSRNLALCLLMTLPALPAFTQSPPTTSLSRRIGYDEARRLVTGENEGNLLNQTNRFTRTKLSSGQVIEIYYPLLAQSGSARSKRVSAPGYGVLYASESAFREATRPRHMLEELIPDGRGFIDQIPQLLARFEKRLGLRPGRLELTRTGLRRVDAFLRNHHVGHSTAQTDPRLFQEVTAVYGETLRRVGDGQWRIREEKVGETYRQAEPNLIISGREIKPWSGVIRALYDEDNRGAGLTKSFDADLGGKRE